MTWVTWRQSRLELLLGAAVLAIVAAVCVWLGLDAHARYDAAGLPCIGDPNANAACWSAEANFLNRFRNINLLFNSLTILPLLLGLLLAAPAVLEIESGTCRLAWTQSVTRRRWLAAKLGFGLTLGAAAALAMTAIWMWWRRPFDTLETRFNATAFNFEGLAPLSYTLFAFALCLAAGVILRRAAPAMGIALVVFLAARLVVEHLLRPRYRPPIEVRWAPGPIPPEAAANFGNGDWTLRQGMVDAAGHAASQSDMQACFVINSAHAIDQ
jgi:hypothetical protein